MSNNSYIKVTFSDLKEFKKKTNDMKILRLISPPTFIDQPVNIIDINFKPLRILSIDPDKEVSAFEIFVTIQIKRSQVHKE